MGIDKDDIAAVAHVVFGGEDFGSAGLIPARVGFEEQDHIWRCSRTELFDVLVHSVVAGAFLCTSTPKLLSIYVAMLNQQITPFSRRRILAIIVITVHPYHQANLAQMRSTNGLLGELSGSAKYRHQDGHHQCYGRYDGWGSYASDGKAFSLQLSSAFFNPDQSHYTANDGGYDGEKAGERAQNGKHERRNSEAACFGILILGSR
jgi:hypothetical protein